MASSRRFIYAGNRSTVLKRMLELGVDVVHVLPTEGSWLAREVAEIGLPATTIASKAEAIRFLEAARFDVFVSTGFRFILPISQLRTGQPEATYVNVHPSALPDLRGADPVPGAILFRRDSGVTCHLMDDGIDTGQAIARRSIPYFDGLDAKLLYHLCFRLEPEVFQAAWEKDFAATETNEPATGDAIYYSFRTGDDCFHADDTPGKLVDRLRAFNTPGKGLRFSIGEENFKAFSADIIPADGARLSVGGAAKWTVSGIYEDCILVDGVEVAVRLAGVLPRPSPALVGKKVAAPLTG